METIITHVTWKNPSLDIEYFSKVIRVEDTKIVLERGHSFISDDPELEIPRGWVLREQTKTIDDRPPLERVFGKEVQDRFDEVNSGDAMIIDIGKCERKSPQLHAEDFQNNTNKDQS